MPRQGDLPEGLTGLARLQALRVRHESFRSDAGRLVEAIEQELAPTPAAPPRGAKGARPAGAGPEELARAARLWDDAERIASSIFDKSSKTRALCHIAKAAVVGDPGHAARLVGDAERVANSVLGWDAKAHALSSVAATVAVTDPGLAERMANSATDQHSREYVLSNVAGGVAATDPDRAERIANFHLHLQRNREGTCAEQGGGGGGGHRSRPGAAHRRLHYR